MKRFLSLFACIGLTACSTTMEGTLQKVQIETPGAHGAVCEVWVNNFHLRARPPQAIQVSRGDHKMEIHCLAPGNREKSITVEPHVLESAFLNIGTGLVPGMTYDYLSGGMFMFPEVVEVDFSDVEVKPMPPPAHHNPDMPPVPRYGLEEFRPSWPALDSDQNRPSYTLQKKEFPVDDEEGGAGSEMSSGAPAETQSTEPVASESEADALTKQHNPEVFYEPPPMFDGAPKTEEVPLK